METNQTPPAPTPGDVPAAPELQPCMVQVSSAPKAKCNPFVTRGSLILLGIYAAGFAALYFLGLRSGPTVALGQQDLVYAKVNAALTLMDAEPSPGQLAKKTNAKAIVDDFYTAATQRQIERKRLVGNPFIFTPEKPKPARVQIAQEDVQKDEVPAELKAAMAKVKTLRLQSVLVGRQTAALVSNNLLTTGQTIKGWTVSRITPREVELKWKDQTYILTLQN